MKVMLFIVCVLVTGFCVFGFLATYEPGVRHATTFRVVYAVTGAGCIGVCLASAVALRRSSGRRRTRS